MTRRNERPVKRTNPSGKTVYVARWTDKTGKFRYGFAPDIPGTYKLRREAQEAIYACYAKEESGPANPSTVGGYFATWTRHHPRSRVTDRTNEGRINAVLDVELEGRALREWEFSDLRRRHATALVDHMLRVQGRAYTGAQNVLRSLSAMTENAIDDEVSNLNPWKGVKVRSTDPRIQKPVKPVRVWSWEQMHAVAAASSHEPMVRVLSDCGLRIGELLALRRRDLDLERGVLEVRQTRTPFGIEAGTKTDKLRANATGTDEPGRVVPVPPALLAMLRAMPKRIDTDLLFPAVRGSAWLYSHWLPEVWTPACKSAGVDARPHEFRHSYVSLMRAAGVDDSDLAEITGHTVLTMLGRYSHSLGRSFDVVRTAVGG